MICAATGNSWELSVNHTTVALGIDLCRIATTFGSIFILFRLECEKCDNKAFLLEQGVRGEGDLRCWVGTTSHSNIVQISRWL
jgi:hypothetical protein